MSSGSFAGAEMITFRAPARCLAASARARNRPVASMTTSTPSFVPRELGGVGLTGCFDAVAVNHDRRVADLDRVVERAVDRVVLQELSDQVWVGDVVDRHPVDVGFTLIGRAGCSATGAAEAVYGNPD